MKQIIIGLFIMLLVACNKPIYPVKYIDETYCSCDSIVREYPALPDTMAVYEYPYKNGLKHGVAKAYNNQRELYMEQGMKNGVFHGVKKSYRNSTLQYIEIYNNGAQTLFISLNPNGSINSLIPHTDNKFNGDVLDFNEFGNISSCTNWDNDRPNGSCK